MIKMHFTNNLIGWGSMTKVVFLLNNMNIGGVQRVNSVIANSLNSQYEVEILLSDFSYRHYTLDVSWNFLPHYTVIDSLIFKGKRKIYNILMKKIDFKKMYHKALDGLNSYLQENHTDVLIVNSDLIPLIPYIKESNPHLKIISWIHNGIDIYIDNYFKRNNDELISGLNDSDKIVVLTQEDKTKLKRLVKNDVTCIYNPLKITNDNNISELNQKRICVVGRLSIMHKGLDYLCEVAKSLPDEWVIELAGDGSKKEKKRFFQLISKNSVENKLIYKGKMNDRELKNFYKCSSIYLMTSRWEGMPLVLAEAMSFGLPIIAFDQSGSREVLSNNDFGVLVENGDIRMMNEELSKLINSKRMRVDYQNKSLTRLRDFQINNIKERWVSIINSLL